MHTELGSAWFLENVTPLILLEFVRVDARPIGRRSGDPALWSRRIHQGRRDGRHVQAGRVIDHRRHDDEVAAGDRHRSSRVGNETGLLQPGSNQLSYKVPSGVGFRETSSRWPAIPPLFDTRNVLPPAGAQR